MPTIEIHRLRIDRANVAHRSSAAPRCASSATRSRNCGRRISTTSSGSTTDLEQPCRSRSPRSRRATHDGHREVREPQAALRVGTSLIAGGNSADSASSLRTNNRMSESLALVQGLAGVAGVTLKSRAYWTSAPRD